MIVQDLIKASMRKIGVLSSGETPESARLTEALGALQVMLRSWASKRILVFGSTKESFTLVSGKNSYTWGVSGDITTTRPHQILGAFVRDSGGMDYPVGIISEGIYRSIQVKTITGRPCYLFYHPLYPQSVIYLYPTPQDAETMWIDSLKPFTETSSFSLVTDTIAFPLNYEEALVYNLAIRIAPEFGAIVPAETVAIARSSFNDLVALNASNQMETIPIDQFLPIDYSIGYMKRYNINTDR